MKNVWCRCYRRHRLNKCFIDLQWFELIVPTLFDKAYLYSQNKHCLNVHNYNEWNPEYSDTICKVLSFGKKMNDGTVLKAAVHVVL